MLQGTMWEFPKSGALRNIDPNSWGSVYIHNKNPPICADGHRHSRGCQVPEQPCHESIGLSLKLAAFASRAPPTQASPSKRADLAESKELAESSEICLVKDYTLNHKEGAELCVASNGSMVHASRADVYRRGFSPTCFPKLVL